MTPRLRPSLRLQLAAAGFVAIYGPILLLLLVFAVTRDEQTVTTDPGDTVTRASESISGWVVLTVVVLAPLAAALAWIWAGRAVAPLTKVREVADTVAQAGGAARITEATGPAEVVALADSFNAMMDRLDLAADTQRRLLEDVSHELRTPLAVLTTNADVLLAHQDPDLELYRAGLVRSKQAADRLRLAIDELTLASRGLVRGLQPSEIDVAALLGRVVADAAVMAEARDVTLRTISPPTLSARVDEASVLRAMTNLVENAVRHSPRKEQVVVELAGRPPYVELTVTDAGPGIPPEEQAKVFDRYWRPSDADEGDGTGLGLAIARQVAEAHGGDVTVDSPGADGRGCTFTLRLRAT
jgi:signal transduction histidine kinase